MKSVIAEFCQNHNGDNGLIAEMVVAAKESGADVAKMQYIRSESLSHRPRFDKGLVDGGRTIHMKRPYDSELIRLRSLDLPDSAHEQFIEHCVHNDIAPMVTVFTQDDLAKVLDLGYQRIKLSSFDCISKPLIKATVNNSRTKQIILSTGCSLRYEIEDAIEIIKDHSNASVLHCVSVYPTPLCYANLSRIAWLKNRIGSTGISDHSNPEVNKEVIAAAASYLGADIIEKHFTILPKCETKDGPVSVSPEQLRQLVDIFKSDDKAQIQYLANEGVELLDLLGEPERELSDLEMVNRDYYQGRFQNKRLDGSFFFNWEIPDEQDNK